jgi:hypothetical protein
MICLKEAREAIKTHKKRKNNNNIEYVFLPDLQRNSPETCVWPELLQELVHNSLVDSLYQLAKKSDTWVHSWIQKGKERRKPTL